MASAVEGTDCVDGCGSTRTTQVIECLFFFFFFESMILDFITWMLTILIILARIHTTY